MRKLEVGRRYRLITIDYMGINVTEFIPYKVYNERGRYWRSVCEAYIMCGDTIVRRSRIFIDNSDILEVVTR